VSRGLKEGETQQEEGDSITQEPDAANRQTFRRFGERANGAAREGQVKVLGNLVTGAMSVHWEESCTKEERQKIKKKGIS